MSVVEFGFSLVSISGSTPKLARTVSYGFLDEHFPCRAVPTVYFGTAARVRGLAGEVTSYPAK